MREDLFLASSRSSFLKINFPGLQKSLLLEVSFKDSALTEVPVGMVGSSKKILVDGDV